MRNGKVKASPRQHGYPRPQLQRESWISLNGEWEFSIDPQGDERSAANMAFDRRIQVPFAPETPLSGVEETGLYRSVWYRRKFDAPAVAQGQRVLLHFGAVDYAATVWLNDQLVMRHEGGYTPFSADITDWLKPGSPQVIVVRAEDDPEDLAKPRGKQDWKPQPHSIWYYRTTGIWQTVWLEVVSATYLSNVRWTPDAENWEIGLECDIGGTVRDDLEIHVELSLGDRILADDVYSVASAAITRRIALPDPGIDDYRNELLWSPESPKLIDARLELRDRSGNVLDRVSSYTALRSVQLLGNRFCLNGKPYLLRLVLDQGYWADGGLTAPDDNALRRDVELAKAMGFNGVRKHQKIEDPRYLYWADRLGLMVGGEMPSCYRFTKNSIERLTSQWMEAIRRDISHPCIIAWVPFNESWGVPNLPDNPAQRDFVRSMYYLTKTLDPTRIVIGNDGWEAIATDIVTIHDYDPDPERIARRYGDTQESSIQWMLSNERPGHKILALPEFSYGNQPIMVTEFGGIAFARDASRTWGYSRADDAEQFAARYYKLVKTVRELPLLAGFCYTQFTDTYQEANGLLYMDRTPKFPIEQIAIATRGPVGEQERQAEASWRGRIMGGQRQTGAPRRTRGDH